MNPRIENFEEKDNILTFTLSGVDVCFANGIRRTILSEIPTVVFRTSPYEKNKANIIENTSRLNNEIIKQRLSCIPIHISDLNIPLNDYLLEIDEENKTDTKMFVTSQHFKIKNIKTNKFLEEKDLRKIFPPYIPSNGKNEYYIEFLRLRPKISNEILGEKIKLTCEFSISSAKDDSMFNVTGTCAYGFTPDPAKIKEELIKNQQKWKDDGKNVDEIKYNSENWKLLEGLRYVKPNSYDFIVESIGVFENNILLEKACDILSEKFSYLNELNEKDEIQIKSSISTMANCYDIILENENYTVGNILNYILYTVFYRDLKQLNYCGFKKMHPHDSESILRLGFESPASNKTTIKTIIKFGATEAIKIINKIKDLIGPNTVKK